MTPVFTEEGSRKFWELLAKPNPRAVATLKRGRKIVESADFSKFGREPIIVPRLPRGRKIVESADFSKFGREPIIVPRLPRDEKK